MKHVIIYKIIKGDNLVNNLLLLSIISGFMSLFGFVIMLIDKNKAKKHQWRIKEQTLFTIAVLLGSPGILLGMYTFRHKTKHKIFVFGIPAILLIQVFIIYYSL